MTLRTSGGKAGFTIIEVLLALAIVGLVLAPLFILQGMIVRTTVNDSRDLQRMFMAKKFLVGSSIMRAPDAQQSAAEKKSADPVTIFKYEYKKVAGESALKKIKNMYQETVTAQWTDQKKKHQERLVTFVYNPESKNT